jgi:4-carboxymuconolactone decarboxylase
MASSEHEKNWQKTLRQLHGGEPKNEFFDRVEKVCPDWVKMTREHLFGDIWSRPGLGLRERSMITIACLVMHGFDHAGLRVQLGFALNLGITREEIFEIIMHVTHYGGWPTGANAMHVAMDFFASKDQPMEKEDER